jgi:hypothetical protein
VTESQQFSQPNVNLSQAYVPPAPQPVPQPSAAPPGPAPAAGGEGKTAMIVGYVLAGASFLLPILGLGGLILGIVVATKPGRGWHGAAIMGLSVVLAIIGFVVWMSLALAGTETTTYSY